MQPRPPLKPLNEALAQLLAGAMPLSASETVATLEADGRVLAQDVVSELHVPPQDNSSMDGYALRCSDVIQIGTVLPQSQRIAAGMAAQPLADGSLARIFTGAPLPPGADAVVMQEDCTVLDASDGARPQVRVNVLPQHGQWIRRAGEDVGCGDRVLSHGTRLGPAELGPASFELSGKNRASVSEVKSPVPRVTVTNSP